LERELIFASLPERFLPSSATAETFHGLRCGSRIQESPGKEFSLAEKSAKA